MESNYQPIKLEGILSPARQTVEIDPMQVYKQITIRLNHKGVVLREETLGQLIKSKQYKAKNGQFTISRIDARNGAMGLIPPELDEAVVTNDFLLYNINEQRLYPRYFDYITSTSQFVNECIKASKGTTNRVRLKPEMFLEIEIPLPSLKEQKRIVAMLDRMTAKIDEAQLQQVEAVDYVEKMWESLLSRIFTGYSVPTCELASELISKQATKYRNMEILNYNGAHPQKPNIYSEDLYEIPENWVWTDLGSILTRLVDCINDTPDFSEEKTEYIGLKSTNIRPYFFDLSEKWYVKEDDFLYWNRRETPKAGDLILTREAPMGNACIIPERVKTCLTQRLILLRCDEEFINPRYLLHYLNSVHFKKQVLDMCRGLTTPHIRVKDVPKVMIPLPPFQTQNQIVLYLDSMKTKLDEIKRIQTETEQDVKSFLPSILQKAFDGKLW